MNGFVWLIWIAVIIGIIFWAWGGFRKQKLAKLRAENAMKKLSEEDWGFLEEHARIATMIPEELKERFEKIIQVLVGEKNFEACGELEEVTREMKIVVMAQAALLLLGREHDFFPELRSVLIYPDAYQGKGKDGDDQTRLGESWDSGSVVLSWRSVWKGGENPADGHNVVIHEFAHQLDQENDRADGLPVLRDRKAIGNWAHAFSEAFEEFCKDLDAGRPTVMDPYGATNPAEFFSVATECFFEKAKQLEKEHPPLYQQLAKYYGLDPARW